jgi:hypothetical protein
MLTIDHNIYRFIVKPLSRLITVELQGGIATQSPKVLQSDAE